jgi:hypothetical protein
MTDLLPNKKYRMLNPTGDFVGQDTFTVSKIKEFSRPTPQQYYFCAFDDYYDEDERHFSDWFARSELGEVEEV